MGQQAVITAQNVSKKFVNHKAVDNVSLEIRAGEVLALLGANGAGKTTFINLLLGRMSCDTGLITVLGQPPGHAHAKQHIGTILQSAEMPGTLKVREHVSLFSSYYHNPLTLQETLSMARLMEIQDKRFDQLSGGQKQRVFFALAICGRPKVVFLDEPTVGLDVDARRDFWNCIRSLSAQGTTVLLTTHYLEEADVLADRIALLHHGKLTREGTPDLIKKQLGGRVIRFRSELQEADLSDIKGVTAYQRKGEYHELISESPEQSARLLLNQCPDIRDLTINQISLEDAFLHLTQNQSIANSEKTGTKI